MIPHIVFDLNVACGAYEPGPNSCKRCQTRRRNRHERHLPATGPRHRPGPHPRGGIDAVAGPARRGRRRDRRPLPAAGPVAPLAAHRGTRAPPGSSPSCTRGERPRQLAEVGPTAERHRSRHRRRAAPARPDLRRRPRRTPHQQRVPPVPLPRRSSSSPSTTIREGVAEHPFRAADVFFSAILAAADDVLADLAPVAGHPCEADRHREEAARTRAALDAAWDEDLHACLDQDRITERGIRADTIGGFAPLIAGCHVDRTAVLIGRLFGPTFAGADGLAWPLPLSTATTDPRFDRRGYWRGPQWPPITWLLWWGINRAGHRRTAEHLRTTAIDQLREVGCTEYVEPFKRGPPGSPAQSWTAAVALDWLAVDT
ncbi:MAG: trehalase family glycosidase [Acidimicrobiales bacterium]